MRKFVKAFLLGIILVELLSGCYLFPSDKYKYKGKGFSVKFPIGWKKIKQPADPGVIFTSTFKPHSVTFITPQEISYFNRYADQIDQIPEASISVYANKLSASIWLEDEFNNILEALSKHAHILDHGQVTIDNQIADWLIYRYDEIPTITLEFYIVTDFNIFYKIIYSTHVDKFKTYRDQFEVMKASFKIEPWF